MTAELIIPQREMVTMSDAEMRELSEYAVNEGELVADIYRSSLYEAFLLSWDTLVSEPLVSSWYLKLLCDEIEKVMRRAFLMEPKLYDLIINIPPGMSKSTILQVARAWAWSIKPSFRSIIASYVHKLAVRSNVKSRDIIRSEWYKSAFPEVVLKSDMDTQAYYQNTQGGDSLAAGVDGSLMGFHAHVIFWDDLLNSKEAQTEAKLQEVKHFDEEVLPSRSVDKRVTPQIGIMQRLHETDPTGRRLKRATKEGATPVRLICLPADDSYPISPPRLKKHYVGGLLDPVRLPQLQIEAIKAEQGEMVYAGQYGQKPTPREGGMFKIDRLNIVHSVPEGEKLTRVIRYWDKAGTKRKTSAYTVGAKLGVVEWTQMLSGQNVTLRKYYVLDIRRFKERAGDRERIIHETAKEDGPEVVVWIEQEPGSGGLDSAELTISNLSGFTCRAEVPTEDKVARADSFASQVDVYKVSLISATWNADYTEELRLFPNAQFKDQVDASSGAFRKLNVTNVGFTGVL